MPIVKNKKRKIAELEATWYINTGDYVTDVAFSPEGSTITIASASGEVWLVEAVSGEVRHKLDAHKGGVLRIVWRSHADTLVSSGQDGMIRAWNPKSGECLAAFAAGSFWAEQIAWNCDGCYLASSSARILRIWNTDCSLRKELQPFTSSIYGLAWNPENQTQLAAICYGELRIFDVNDPEMAISHEWPGALISAAWSPDGKYIACGTQDGGIQVWQIDALDHMQMNGYEGKVNLVRWNMDGTLLATDGSPDCAVWDFTGEGPKGRTPRIYSLHQDFISALAWGNKHNAMVTGGRDGGLAVWMAGDKTPHAALVRSFAVTCVSIAADDSWLAVGYEDGVVAGFPMPV